MGVQILVMGGCVRRGIVGGAENPDPMAANVDRCDPAISSFVESHSGRLRACTLVAPISPVSSTINLLKTAKTSRICGCGYRTRDKGRKIVLFRSSRLSFLPARDNA